ncbi:MAG: NADPH:quinone oxidoreductase family protein [Novosphingobium sp.]
MKAVLADDLEAIESYRLRDADRPRIDPDEVLIRVEGCGVGYVDALEALGRYQVKPALPFSPGHEIAGVVEEVGREVSGLSAGTRVIALAHHGFAEYVAAPASMAFPMPAAMSFAQGAGFPLNFLTVLHGLRDRGQLAAGETVLVFGAAGGVGSAAIQVARAMGTRVIAAASTGEKRDYALANGADAAIDTHPEGWRDRLKAACGGAGPNVIFDPVCGPLFEPAFRSLAWGGRHLVVGFVGGPIPALPAHLSLLKGAALCGVDVRQYMLFEQHRLRDDFRQLLGWAAHGGIKPPVGEIFKLEEFADALNLALSGKARGKIVLQVAASPATA